MKHQLRIAMAALMIVTTGGMTAEAGLIAHYQFESGDSGAVDSAGANDGTFQGDATLQSVDLAPVPGGTTAALELDGDGDYARINAGLLEGLNELSVAFWLRKDAQAASESSRFVASDDNNVFAIRESNDQTGGSGPGNHIEFRVTDSSGNWQKALSNSAVTPLGQWQHIAMVYDGDDLIGYVDGNEVARETIGPVTTNAPSDPTQIGANFSSGSAIDGFLDGGLDDLRFYDHALSSSDVQALAPSSPPAPGPWTRHTIQAGGPDFDGADGARGMDIDGDGDVDLVSGAEESGVTRLYLNPGPANATDAWPQRMIGNTPNVEDALLVDLDGDGHLDVLSSSEGPTNQLTAQFAPSDGDFLNGTWEQKSVDAAPDRQWMFAEPLGDRIIVGSKETDGELGLLTPDAASPRDTSTWAYEKLTDMGWTMSIIARDMDGDNDVDILVSDRRAGGTQRGVYWLENGENWTRNAVDVTGDSVMFLDIGDLDGDGYDDILAPQFDSSDNSVLNVHFGDGTGLNWNTVTINWPGNFGRAKAASIADVDGDGQNDIVLSAALADGVSGIVWLEYVDSPMDADWLRHEISGLSGDKFDLIDMLDLDGDGDLDVLTTEEGVGVDSEGLGVVWYENPVPEPISAVLVVIGGMTLLGRRGSAGGNTRRAAN